MSTDYVDNDFAVTDVVLEKSKCHGRSDDFIFLQISKSILIQEQAMFISF